MLRRLPLGFAGVVLAAIAIAACSSSDATKTISVGPTFTSQTLYAADVTQNAVNIYTPNPKSTAGPQYQIGGSNTTLAGPQYLAFDATNDLWVTNWLASTNSGLLLEFKAEATGDVLPFQSYAFGSARPRGIAGANYTFSGASSATSILAVGVVDPAQPAGYTSDLDFFQTSSATAPYLIVGGPATQLNVPSGVAFDSNDNVYVANLQGGSVSVFAIPTASPTPSPSASASPTASPSASASPTVAPSATPLDSTPIAVIGAGTLGQPTGVAVDGKGNVYVSDQALKACSCPAVLEFAAGSGAGSTPTAIIDGSNTLLAAPTDVKVDSSGNIYVADTVGGSGVVYVFSAGSNGNVAPASILKSPGSIIGLGLTP